MVSLGQLAVDSVGYGLSFNWIWLVELLVCGVLVLFFLFYFNRLFASLISYAVRAYTWHRYRVYIDIQALQFSFLAGRIFFKGIRYHGQNETIFVQNGYVTWMYWLRSVRQVDLARYEEPVKSTSHSPVEEEDDKSKDTNSIAVDRETGPVKKADNAQARIAVVISGLEWFIYNRTPVYDSIIAESLPADHEASNGQDAHASGVIDHSETGHPIKLRHKGRRGGGGKRSQSSSGEHSTLSEFDPRPTSLDYSEKETEPRSLGHQTTRSTVIPSREGPSVTLDPSQSLIVRFLPVMIECQKGAISLGNQTTRALLVTTFDKAKGHIDASSSGPLDVFRQLFDFDIEHPVIQMRPNPDFRQSQQAAAERVLADPKFDPPQKRWWSINLHFHRRKRKLYHGLRNLVPFFRSSVDSFHASSQDEKRVDHEGNWQTMEPDTGQWLGLSRYLDDDERDDHEGWAHVDYARFSTILDCPSIQMNFYWDVPGKVSEPGDHSSYANSTRESQDINRSDPPGYGIDLCVRGGTLNYGPWADRLRAELQNAFLPNPYRSAKPAPPLSVSEQRQSTIMIIRVEIQDEVTLRVPTKESSKDWQWRGRSNTLRRSATVKKQRSKKHFRFRRGEKTSLGPDVRPFGWLSFSVGPDSTVRYEMDLVARVHGYYNHLELDLKRTRVVSSVNHGLLWRCQSQQVTCDLSNPLGWNSLHTWAFQIHSEAMQLFLLRDHMFLLTDLIDDFTSGPKPDYMTFVPFYYHIGLTFAGLKLYLNANDSNIIDNPSDLEDNTFLILGLQELNSAVDIPIQNFSASQNSVLFRGNGRVVSLDLNTPLWNTLHTFVSHDPIATLRELNLDGSYNYCADVSPQSTDSLVLDISGTSPRVFLHGFLIRYFMNVKENYFGDDLHFKTLEEYQESLAADNKADIAQALPPIKKENDLDVILTVRANQSCALMPGNIYSRKNNMRFDILLVEADMRFTNYYMDLDVKSSPIEVSLESLESEAFGVDTSVSNCQLFIDGVLVTGHRLFGAPPSEPTYVCNWDFGVGKIVGQCSTAFLHNFIFSIKSFILTLDDDENALPIAHSTVIHDITFLKAHVDGIRIWLVTEETAFLVSTAPVDVSFDDWARSSFSKQVQASIPNILLAAVDGKSAIRHHGEDNEQVPTVACFEMSLKTKVVDKKANFARERALQQHHVRFHDRRTHRADWVLHGPNHDSAAMKQAEWADRPPAMPVPMPPQPAFHTVDETARFRNTLRESPSGRKLRRQSSFLSISSSSRRVGRKLSRRQPAHNASSAQHTTVQHLDHQTALSASDQTAPPSFLTFSSPWTSPYFSLQNVVPDLRNLPTILPAQQEILKNAGVKVARDEDNTPPSAAVGITHTGVFCELDKGFRGFCTPEFFFAISSLVRDLEPKHPIDQLDTIHIEAISEIMSTVNRPFKPGKITDLSFQIPFALVKMISTTRDQQNVQKQDQYDILTTQIQATIRISDDGLNLEEEGTAGLTQGPLMHALAREITLSVSERSADGSHDRASAKGTISDLGFWLGSRDKRRTRLQLKSIELATWGRRIEYLASLIQRTGAMTENLVQTFQGLGENQLTRHLVYHLTLQGSVADPLFLTRPSYVLRSASNRLRLDDSWKILCRLRHVYESLPKSTKEDIVNESFGHRVELPEDVQQHVLSSFDQWRNWDHDGLENTPLMHVIFGTSAASSEPSEVAKAVEADLYIGSTALVLDPGANQSALVLGDMNAGVSATQSYANSKEAFRATGNTLLKIQVQTYISRIALNVDWEVVELVGDTLEQFKLSESNAAIVDKLPMARSVSDAPKLDLSVVLGTDSASIIVDTINLNLRLAAEKLQASLSHLELENHRQNSSIVVGSTTASAKLRSKDKALLGWRLFFPTVYGSYISDVEANISNDLRLAATCQRLRFDLKEDILGMLRLVYRIVGDEVGIIQGLVSRIDGLNLDKPRKGTTDAHTAATNIHIAMFLDDYKLKFAILPSFHYVIAGQVARTSIVPRRNSSLIVDFDLKDNRHFFRTGEDRDSQSTPALGVPPINGRIMVSFLKKVTSLNMQTTFEKIDFETTAVRACIDALNRPDLARIIGDAKASVQRIKTRVTQIFVSNTAEVKVPAKLSSPLEMQYTTHTTLAGFNIHCGAPSIKGDDISAEVDLMLGFTTLSLHNTTGDEGVIHEQPQFEVNVRELVLGIRRTSHFENTNFGKVGFNVRANGTTELDDSGNKVRVYRASSDGFNVDLYAETASLVVDVAAFLQERIKSFTLNDEARNFRPLRRLTIAGLDQRPAVDTGTSDTEDDAASGSLFDAVYSLDLATIQVRWLLYDEAAASHRRELEDLIFSIQKIDLKTKREGSARLAITNLQLQMVPKSLDPIARSSNSALMPEMVFKAAYLSSKHDRRFAFQAAGKALDLRLASDFIVPASMLQTSLALASAELRNAKANWASSPVSTRKENTSLLGSKRLASLLMDADFAGAVVTIKPREEEARSSVFGILKGKKRSRAGRYGQAMHGEAATEVTLRAPGIAMKVQYQDDGRDDPTLSAEFKVAASSNVLYPSVVPLILEISSSIKEIIGDTKPTEAPQTPQSQTSKYLSDATLNNGDPTAILGRCKLNAGLWIQSQEFSLSCQPIARVAATARFDDIFMTVNTVQSHDQDRFFALVTTFNKLHASVQHVYSRESTASFDVDSIVVSMMNSKHVSSRPGISAILKISPMKADINAKQLQDFLLFREIWYPPELRQAPSEPAPAPAPTDAHLQRYQQAVATGSFLWNAVVSVEELKVQVDLGQGLGKSAFTIAKLWASSKKASDFEQNLCVGFEKVGVDSTGRMSGFVELQNFRLRTSIRWPHDNKATKRAPLVQGSLGFDHLRVKAAFDYQPFAVADISSFEFLMYNVRQPDEDRDRLVGILTGDKVQIFCTTASAAQGLALYQAFERLVQERQEAYQSSLLELDKHLRRKSIFPSAMWTTAPTDIDEEGEYTLKVPFSLHTDVVVTLREVSVGVFPTTFFDNQIFKAEVTDAQARFAVATRNKETHSILGMTLGQLRVALANVSRGTTQALGEVSVPDVIQRATTSRGGTILKVPKVIAAMSTWQMAGSNTIEYTFKSLFEGKVDVGWNYSRISFIRGMWTAHSRALAQRLGKPLPQSAVKITAEPKAETGHGEEKITAVVNVPQSKFDYVAREPPIIDTPQLHDLGEATPRLEWLGLHRERLPGVTHQFIIVTLLEIAKEVEDAYSKILGSA